MPIPASPDPLRAAGEGFQPRDLAGLALLCARSWGVPRAAVMERLERTDWEEAERRLSQRRPVSLDLGTVDLLASRTFRSGLGASSPNPGSPVPGRLLCGVRSLGDGRMEAAMAACLDRSFLSGHPEYRNCGAVTLSACGPPGLLGPALHRRLDLDLGPMKAAPVTEAPLSRPGAQRRTSPERQLSFSPPWRKAGLPLSPAVRWSGSDTFVKTGWTEYSR